MSFLAPSTLAVAAAALLCTVALPAQKLHTHEEPPASSAAAPPPAPANHALMSVESYEHLLNLIFPSDRAIKPGLDYTIVLRFEPHAHPESQVVLHRYHSGKVEASFDRVLEGSAWRAAYQTGADLHAAELADVAKAVEVRHLSFTTNDAEVTRWHTELFPLLGQSFTRVHTISRQIEHSGSYKAMLNGTRYELWLIQGDDEIHLVSWDNEVEPTPSGSTGLIKWMNTIRWTAAGHTLAPKANAQPAEAKPADVVAPNETPSTPGSAGGAKATH